MFVNKETEALRGKSLTQQKPLRWLAASNGGAETGMVPVELLLFNTEPSVSQAQRDFASPQLPPRGRPAGSSLLSTFCGSASLHSSPLPVFPEIPPKVMIPPPASTLTLVLTRAAAAGGSHLWKGSCLLRPRAVQLFSSRGTAAQESYQLGGGKMELTYPICPHRWGGRGRKMCPC